MFTCNMLNYEKYYKTLHQIFIFLNLFLKHYQKDLINLFNQNQDTKNGKETGY